MSRQFFSFFFSRRQDVSFAIIDKDEQRRNGTDFFLFFPASRAYIMEDVMEWGRGCG